MSNDPGFTVNLNWAGNRHAYNRPQHHHHIHIDRPVPPPVNVHVTHSAPPAYNPGHTVTQTTIYPNLPTAPVQEPCKPGSNESGYTWVPTNSNSSQYLQNKAVEAGYEAHDRSPIYVGRAWFQGNMLPCKVIPRHNAAYVCHDGKEISVTNFELYCKVGPELSWVASSNGSVPSGAVCAGNNSTGEPMYVGRAHHAGSLTPGKVHCSHGCIYIPFSGNEISIKSYEVLTLR